MNKFEDKKEISWHDAPDIEIVDGELLDVSTGEEIEQFEEEKTKISPPKKQIQKPKIKDQRSLIKNRIQNLRFNTFSLPLFF